MVRAVQVFGACVEVTVIDRVCGRYAVYLEGDVDLLVADASRLVDVVADLGGKFSRIEDLVGVFAGQDGELFDPVDEVRFGRSVVPGQVDCPSVL